MKILVIGAGSIGKRHVRNSLKFASVAVYDSDKNKVNEITSDSDAIGFESENKAWAWGADGVIIATPNHTHLKLAERAVNKMIPALIEKPISNNIDNVEKLLQLADKKGIPLFVVANMRYNSAIQTLKKSLPSIGKPLYARAHYGNYLPNMRPNIDYRTLYAAHKNQGGGVILDCIHEIDYLMWMFGAVSRVTVDKSRLSDLDIDVEDYATLIAEHENGFRSVITMDYLRPFKRRGCEIIGTDGILLWESEGKIPEECIVKIYIKNTQLWKTIFEDKNLDGSKPYELMILDFIKALKGKENSLAKATEGLAALKASLLSLPTLCD